MFKLKVSTTTIKDKDFQIELLPAGEGIAMAQKLSTLVLPILSNTNGEFSFDFSKLATALSVNISEKEFLLIIKRLLKGLCVDGKEVAFDDYFQANYGELLKIITFALTENFGSFFEELASTEV